MKLDIEQLKAEYSAWEDDSCPAHLRLYAGKNLADAFPGIIKALEESVKLQSHYARILNGWDGGKRIEFVSADDWIERLYEVEVLK
jgi:hypothetical protein